ncbi:hypothetical protein BC941DRAFT_435084 [Chlamydoabsidia padenii]|nr:hypothetical protein BC941DRAFT_435084 [Chlamydoabsidia padenii]
MTFRHTIFFPSLARRGLNTMILIPFHFFLFRFNIYIYFIKIPGVASSNVARSVYNSLFKKNSVFVTSIFVSAIAL